MSEFLRIISDIRVVIAIAVLIVILVMLLIIHRVRTKRFKNELAELENQYILIKNIPVSLKMNKAVAIARVDQDTNTKMQDAQLNFDNVQADISKIGSDLADAEDLIVSGKLKKADLLMEDVEKNIATCDTQVKALENQLDEILAKEIEQRQEVNTLKNRFRALKSQALENETKLAFAWPMIEHKVSDTEKMFSTFEEWMYSNDFDKANKELVSIKNSISELDQMLEDLPDLIQDARGIIPKMAENLHHDYAEERKRGVYLKHLDVEKNLSAMTVTLKEDIKKLKGGTTEGVKEHLDDYKQRISQLAESVHVEGKAFDELNKLKAETESIIKDANKNANYVNEGYAKHSTRFGLDSLKGSLDLQNEELNRLNNLEPEVSGLIKDETTPASTALSSLKELNRDYVALNNHLKETRSQIEIATGDEDRAKKQLVKLQIIMNQMQVKMRKYKLPNISTKYQDDMDVANDYIHRLQDLIDETPLNIQLLNSTLQEAINFIYRLYNNVNNVVGTVVMVENTIVFGNRYRSTYADIDSELTRSELSFRNGEYTQALTTAIATIEKIHPGNYESMIKENARSAS